MPIRPEMRDRYPRDWPAISRRVRHERAGDVCEAEGCGAVNGRPHPITGSKVVLTTAHLNHDPADCRDGNLAAYCQYHHLAYDAEHHRQTRRSRKAARDLFEAPDARS